MRANGSQRQRVGIVIVRLQACGVTYHMQLCFVSRRTCLPCLFAGFGNPAAPQPLSLRRCSTQPSPPEVFPAAAAAVRSLLQTSVASAPASAAFGHAPAGGSGSAVHQSSMASLCEDPASAVTQQPSQPTPNVGITAAGDLGMGSGGPRAAVAVLVASAGAAETCCRLHQPSPRAHTIAEHATAPELGTNGMDVWTGRATSEDMEYGNGGATRGSHGARAATPQLLRASAAGDADVDGQQGAAGGEAWVRAGGSEVAFADQPGWAELCGDLSRFAGGMDGGGRDGSNCDIVMHDSACGGEG